MAFANLRFSLANVSDMTSLPPARGVSLTLLGVVVYCLMFVLSFLFRARVCLFWFCSIFKTKSAFKSLVSFYFNRFVCFYLLHFFDFFVYLMPYFKVFFS